jgi:hypothetical protein
MVNWRPDEWDRIHFYLHFNTPYKLQSKEMDAYLKGVDDGATYILNALIEESKKPKIRNGKKGINVFIPDDPTVGDKNLPNPAHS